MNAPPSENTTFSDRLFKYAMLPIGVATCLVIFIVLYRIEAADRKARACEDNLRRIGAALHQYHDRYRSFPPAYVVNDQGKRMHSWRVLLLPFLGHSKLYKQYRLDEPWDSAHNRKLLNQMPAVYGCPEDKKRLAGTTNYFAIVGPQTVWPEHCALSYSHIIEGTSNTLMLIETVDTGIKWLEPRDLSYEEFRKAGFRTNPRPSYSHLEKLRTLFVDGSIQRVDRQIDARVFRGLCTPAGGRPFPGVDWDLPVATAKEFQTEPRLASELARTDIMPHPYSPIVPGRSFVYCATFQIAWDQLRSDVVKAPIELEGSPKMARHLNDQPFPRDDLSERAYVALAGSVSDGILDRIRSQLAEKFPSAKPRLLARQKQGILAYAYLQKRLPFEMDFDRLKQPMQFRAAGTETDVVSFGIEDFASHARREKELRKQVTVFDYVSDDDFIIQLTTQRDAIILAKVARCETLAQTLAQVKARIRQPVGHFVQTSLDFEEPLVVPVISLFVEREYTELVGRSLKNRGFAGLDMAAATQLIRFQLDESGAILESEATPVVLNGDEPPPQPRRFVFDRPFLIYLQERKAKQPYFVMWVENPEVLVQEEETVGKE